MLRTRVRSWPGHPASCYPACSEPESASLWLDKLKLSVQQDSGLTTSDTILSDTVNGNSQSLAEDPDCDSASQTTYEDARSHITTNSSPRVSIGSVNHPTMESSEPQSESPSTESPCPLTDGTIGTTNTTPSDPTPNPLPCPITHRMIPAKQQLTPIERLKSLNIKSSLQLTADESVDFSREEQNILDEFVFVIVSDWSRMLRESRFPVIIPCLVSVTDHSSPPRSLGTYICIKGLEREKQIRIFHNIVSRKAVRSSYAPLKVCYDTRLIRYAASEDMTAEVAVSNTPFSSGQLLRTKRTDGSEYLTTIGGLISFGDSCYLMTSSDHHHTSQVPDSAETGYPGSDNTDIDIDDDWSSISLTTCTDEQCNDNAEPPLILRHEETEGMDGVVAPERCVETKHPPSGSVRTLKSDTPEIMGNGSDTSQWRLIAAPDNLEEFPLSNYISIPAGIFDATVTSGYIRTHRPCENVKAGTRVAINAGLSGIGGGNMIGAPSYLVSDGKVQKVWTIKLDSGTNLQRGDSGSWVLDSSLRVLGSVLAISYGNAYIVSIDDQLKQITDVLARREEDQMGKYLQAEVTSFDNIMWCSARRTKSETRDPRRAYLSVAEQTLHLTEVQGDRDGGSPQTTRHTKSHVLHTRPGLAGNSATEEAPKMDVPEFWSVSTLDEGSTVTLGQRNHASSTSDLGLGKFNIMCLILNRTIGSVIFVQAPNVLVLTGDNVGMALALWVGAGLITLVSLLTWINLGLLIPSYGTYQVPSQRSQRERIPSATILGRGRSFLYYIFPQTLLGELAIVLSSLPPFVTYPAAVTFNALQFGIHVVKAGAYSNGLPSRSEEASLLFWVLTGIMLSSLFFTIGLRRKFAVWLNNAFAMVKVMILVAIIGIGCTANASNPDRRPARYSLDAFTHEPSSTSERFRGILAGVSFAMFAYGGFDQALFTVHESQPRRHTSTLVKPALAAMGLVFIMFPLVNMAFYGLVPPNAAADSEDVTSRSFESVSGGLFTDPNTVKAVLHCIVSFSALGNIVAMAFTASRVPLRLDNMRALVIQRNAGGSLSGSMAEEQWESSKYSGGVRLHNRLNTILDFQQEYITEMTLIPFAITAAVISPPSNPSRLYDILCLVVAYSDIILPGIFLTGYMLYAKRTSRYIQPLWITLHIFWAAFGDLIGITGVAIEHLISTLPKPRQQHPKSSINTIWRSFGFQLSKGKFISDLKLVRYLKPVFAFLYIAALSIPFLVAVVLLFQRSGAERAIVVVLIAINAFLCVVAVCMAFYGIFLTAKTREREVDIPPLAQCHFTDTRMNSTSHHGDRRYEMVSESSWFAAREAWLADCDGGRGDE